MEYIDLNLPSGNLWAVENEDGLYSYDEAVEKYGDQLPTEEDWNELLDNTTSVWMEKDGVRGRRFTNKDGESLFLPAAGYHDGTSLYCAGSYGLYWSSSLYESSPDSAWYFYFYSGSKCMHCSTRDTGLSVRLIKKKDKETQKMENTEEQTMEDYKKKYEEALERAKFLKENTDGVGAKDVSRCFEQIFPELSKQSKDEKMVRELLEYLSERRIIERLADTRVKEEWIAWLESKVRRTDLEGEEDETLLNLSLVNLTELKHRFGEEYSEVGNCIEWLKSIKERMEKNNHEENNA